MQSFDIVMAVVLGGSILIGLEGMVYGKSAWLVRFWSVSLLRDVPSKLADAIQDIGEPEYLSSHGSDLHSDLHGHLVPARLHAKKLEKHDMKTFDHQTGGLLGIVNGALLCSSHRYRDRFYGRRNSRQYRSIKNRRLCKQDGSCDSRCPAGRHCRACK